MEVPKAEVAAPVVEKAIEQPAPIAKIEPVSVPAPVAKAVEVEPETPADEATARVVHRADLLSIYASLRGIEASASDIAESMLVNAPDDVSSNALAAGLQAVGVTPEIHENAKLDPESWPGLALMVNGQCVLVLGQVEDVLTVYDQTNSDNRTEVPVSDFAPVFSGTVIAAKTNISQVAEKHVPFLNRNHWFWGEFPRYKRHISEIMLGSFIANLLAVAVALFSLQVYDRVIPHQSEATLWVLAIGAFLAIGLEGLLKFARSRLMDGAGRQLELSVQQRLMQRILGMRSDRKPMPPSGLFAVMREFGSVREFFTSSTISTIADVPYILVFLLLVSSIAGNLVWLLVLGGILMVLPGYFMQKKMIDLTRQTQGASAKAGRLLHEVIMEHDTVKTQRGEERIERLWEELNVLASHTSAEQRKLSSMLTLWSQGVQQATYVMAVVIGTYLVFAGEFTVGTIIATGILTSRTLAPLTQLTGTMARWSNVKNALDGLEAIAEAPQEKEADRTYLRRENFDGEFELRETEFRYDEDGAPTLELPAIAIPAGQSLAVLGANGSGKSTLLKLLSGLYGPTKGRVLIDGVDMLQIDPKDLRRGIGYLSQDVRLFAGSLRENLNLNLLERDDKRLLDALDFAGLGPFVRAHHKGLDLEIRDGGDGLSIGQRQSIGWARLWLQDPKIVLLDEPTAALDQALETALVARLGEWLKGRTSVIATHRMPILALTERTMILQAGRMVVDGPRDQVMAHLAQTDGKKG
ncbi:ATP-binding cassette domain-containing protein [Cochlodiniinecator piscidefendens]|uniref:ATP-binding cassette domain-containing protein n=1 Tax=Cochlodiniinecator piscidefendens TaxID=2715756 RepID=UPI0038B2FFD5